MKVVVSGGRYFDDEKAVFAVLDYIDQNVGRIDQLAHGGCRGADLIAGRWAREHHRTVSEYMADWNTFGRRAGPIRNGRMLRSEKPDIVVAFPGGTGTANLVSQAEDMRIRVFSVAVEKG